MSTRRFVPPAASLALVGAAALVAAAFGPCVQAAGPDKAAKEPLKVSAVELSKAYNTDTGKANDKYLDKLLEIEGTVIDADTIGLVVVSLAGFNEKDGQPRVLCSMKDDSKVSDFKKGAKVKIKGKCKGGAADGKNVEVTNCELVK